jgi:hypothetical protein
VTKSKVSLFSAFLHVFEDFGFIVYEDEELVASSDIQSPTGFFRKSPRTSGALSFGLCGALIYSHSTADAS